MSFREVASIRSQKPLMLVFPVWHICGAFFPSGKAVQTGTEVELALERVNSADSLALGKDLLCT